MEGGRTKRLETPTLKMQIVMSCISYSKEFLMVINFCGFCGCHECKAPAAPVQIILSHMFVLRLSSHIKMALLI